MQHYSSNIGTQYTLYDNGDNEKKDTTPVSGEALRQELAAICYDTNVVDSERSRKMTVIVPGIADPDRYIRAEIRPTSASHSNCNKPTTQYIRTVTASLNDMRVMITQTLL